MENFVRPPMVPTLVRACRPRGNYATISTRNDDSLCMLPPKAVVLYDFHPQTEREVAVLVGDMVDCIAVDADRKWLYVRTLRNTAGYVPAAYCRFLAVIPQQQSQPSRTHGPAADSSYASLDRRALRRMPSPLLPSPATNPLVTCNPPAALNPSGFGTGVTVTPPTTLPDRAETTLSPCSFASASSGISTGGTDSQNDSRSEQTDDFCSFNRAAVAQYGSASGSSSCSSACERRIKMLKTNGQKKIQRTKSAEMLAEPSNSNQTLNAGSDKMIDILWSQTLRKHTNAADNGRPVAVRALHTNPTVKNEAAKQSLPSEAGNQPEKVVCETFV